MAKVLMKGNEAIAEAAIQAGCRYFFGYPITPQNQIPEYMSKRMPKIGGVFLQAESEVSAINMVYGAGGAGARVMTSSSSPGISLKQEGISYCVGSEIPCVIVNIVRGGPGLGGIQAAQSDYFQATKGGGHGDYRMVVFAPASVQEAVDLTQQAFDVADEYRNPVMILGDGVVGQMMEPVEISAYPTKTFDKSWAAGEKGAERAIVNSLFIDPEALENHNHKLQKKFGRMEKEMVRVETIDVEGADIIVTAYGTTARIARKAASLLREETGLKVGIVRPITLWPFPYEAMAKAIHQDSVRHVVSIEMSAGQMIEDVRLAAADRKPVSFFGRSGGIVPSVKEIMAELTRIGEGK